MCCWTEPRNIGHVICYIQNLGVTHFVVQGRTLLICASENISREFIFCIRIHRYVFLGALFTLLEPLSVDTLPVIEIKEALNEVFQTFLQLHWHFQLNNEVFNCVIKVYAKIIILEEKYEVDVKFCFERFYVIILFVVVESRHTEKLMDLASLFSIEFKSHPIKNVFCILLVPIPTNFPINSIVHAILIIIIFKQAFGAVISCFLNNWRLKLQIVLAFYEISFSTLSGKNNCCCKSKQFWKVENHIN